MVLKLPGLLQVLLHPPDVINRGLEDGALVPAHVPAGQQNQGCVLRAAKDLPCTPGVGMTPCFGFRSRCHLAQLCPGPSDPANPYRWLRLISLHTEQALQGLHRHTHLPNPIEPSDSEQPPSPAFRYCHPNPYPSLTLRLRPQAPSPPVQCPQQTFPRGSSSRKSPCPASLQNICSSAWSFLI